MEEQREKLYVPSYVKAQAEYFPGFGKKELRISIFMSLFVLGASVIAYIITGDLAIVILMVLVGVTATIIVNTKNEANLSVVMFVMLALNYLKEQQRYLYQYISEWKK